MICPAIMAFAMAMSQASVYLLLRKARKTTFITVNIVVLCIFLCGGIITMCMVMIYWAIPTANVVTTVMFALVLGLVGAFVVSMKPKLAIPISLISTVFVFVCMIVSYDPTGTARPAWTEWLG